jgi:hypothetical protein
VAHAKDFAASAAANVVCAFAFSLFPMQLINHLIDLNTRSNSSAQRAVQAKINEHNNYSDQQQCRTLYTNKTKTTTTTKMSSLDGVFTLQAEELFEKSTLERINDLSDAEAIALLPAIHAILDEEVASWANHCEVVQSINYNTIVTKLHELGADVEMIITMATYHVLVTVPTRFAVLDSKSRGKSREPLSKILDVLRGQIQRYATPNGAEYVMDTQRHSFYSHDFAKAMSELEATMTGLENSRMEQLRRVRMVLFGELRAKLTNTKHVVAFVIAMERMGIIDFDSVLSE